MSTAFLSSTWNLCSTLPSRSVVTNVRKPVHSEEKTRNFANLSRKACAHVSGFLVMVPFCAAICSAMILSVTFAAKIN